VKASGFLEPTPGAALPANDFAGTWLTFSDRQTAQLDRSNADKAGAQRILEHCAAWQEKAAAAAKPRRRFGLF